MTSQRRLRIIWTVLLVGWLCVIWGHSLMPADVSSNESSRFLFLVRPFFEAFGSSDEHLMTHVIRKTAHFLENIVLMLIATRFGCVWWGKSRKALVAMALIWVCVPVIDEVIQMLSPGRSPQVSDVFLDMCGGAVGVIIALLVMRLHEDEPDHAKSPDR